MPLAQAFAMFTIAAIRNGQHPSGPSYEMQDIIRDVEAAGKHS